MVTEHDNRRWYQGITRYQWIVLIVASLGWVFDVFEGQIFVAAESRAMPELTGEEKPRAIYTHLIFSAFLLGGALGGVFFGMLSDRIGRTKTLSLTILIYSLFTSFSAFAQNWWQMAGFRFLMAMGVGGEWAVASTLVAEVFPKRARAWSQSIFHASSVLGTYLAVAAGYFIISNTQLSYTFDLFGSTWVLTSWRIAFLLGVIPALLIIWVRLSLKEPDKWLAAKADAAKSSSARSGRVRELFSPALKRSTLVGVTLAAVGLATFWGVHVFGKNKMKENYQARYPLQIPANTTEEQQEEIKAENEKVIQRGEMFGMLLVTTGGGIGLVLFGPISQRIGRRKAFLWFHVGGLISSVILFQLISGFGPLCIFLPIFGFLTLGMHAGYALYFPELFPTHLRGTGAGFCFNVGRVLAAPMLILRGAIQDWGLSLANAATVLSLSFLLVVIILRYAPETRGEDLPE